jgi:hypothetical protein
MKRMVSIALVVIVVLQIFTIQTLATDEPLTLNARETAQFYDLAVQQVNSEFSVPSQLEIRNAGIEVYESGLVRQSIIVQQKAKTAGTISGNVIDYWYRLFDKSKPICRVMIFAEFDFDGSHVEVVRDGYDFTYYIYSDYKDDTSVRERSVKFTDGGGALNPYSRVDTEYIVDFLSLSDTETISISCDKDGNLTRYGQDESI